jgi:hypothetical protein
MVNLLDNACATPASATARSRCHPGVAPGQAQLWSGATARRWSRRAAPPVRALLLVREPLQRPGPVHLPRAVRPARRHHRLRARAWRRAGPTATNFRDVPPSSAILEPPSPSFDTMAPDTMSMQNPFPRKPAGPGHRRRAGPAHAVRADAAARGLPVEAAGTLPKPGSSSGEAASTRSSPTCACPTAWAWSCCSAWSQQRPSAAS